jgi:hypothetical protein
VKEFRIYDLNILTLSLTASHRAWHTLRAKW